jgi:hypothetical protein
MMILITLSGCGTTCRKIDISAATDAAAKKAIAEYPWQLPSFPDGCYVDTPHAQLKEGDEAIVFGRKEYDQLNLANNKRRRCINFYSTLQAKKYQSTE